MDEVQNFFNTSVTIKWNSTGAGNFYVGQLPAVANGYLVVNRNSSSKREIIKYTGTGTDGNGPFITVLDAGDRGLGGTTAQTHEIGETVQMTITAQHWSDLIATLDGIVNDGAPTATTTVRGIVKMNTVPADPADPIVIGPNDPLLDKPTGEPTAFVTTSAGAGDEGKGVKLNASGFVDETTIPFDYLKTFVTSSDITTKNIADANTTQTIAHGLGVAPKKVKFHAVFIDGKDSHVLDGIFDASGQRMIGVIQREGGSSPLVDILYTSTTNALVLRENDGASPDINTGTVSVDATNINIAWVKTGTPTGTFTIFWEAEGVTI